MSVVLYLLGFPTPIVELVLAGALLFFLTALYFGFNFTGLEEGDADQEGESAPEGKTARVEGSET